METINEALSQSDLNDILEQVARNPESSDNLEVEKRDLVNEDILIIENEDKDEVVKTVDKDEVVKTVQSFPSNDEETDSGESQDTEEEESEEYVDIKDLGNIEKVAIPETPKISESEVELPEKIEEDTVCTILIYIWIGLFLLCVFGYIIFFHPTYTSKCCFSFHNLSFCKFSNHCEQYLRALNYHLSETILRLCCYSVTPYNTSNSTVLCLHSCLEEGQVNLY